MKKWLLTGLFLLLCSSNTCRISRIASCWNAFPNDLKWERNTTLTSEVFLLLCGQAQPWGELWRTATCGHPLSSTSHPTHDTRRRRWNWVGRQREKVRAVGSAACVLNTARNRLGAYHFPLCYYFCTLGRKRSRSTQNSQRCIALTYLTFLWRPW